MTRQLFHHYQANQHTQWARSLSAVYHCLCLPYTLPRELKRKLNRQREERTKVPLPLPRKRPRALSLLGNGKKDENFSSLRNRAGFIGRFPPEIREMIYTYVLGNRVIHIQHKPYQQQRLISHDCERLHDMIPRTYCQEVMPRKNLSSGTKTALLKTCRLIYIEGIRVLYSTNVFGCFASRVTALSYFFRTVLPQRLSMITTLYITCDTKPLVFRARESLQEWSDVWQQIATEMTSLRVVRLWLIEASRQPLLELRFEAEWIQALLPVKHLSRFELYVDPFFPSCLECGSDRSLWPGCACEYKDRFSPEYCDTFNVLRESLRMKLCA